MKVTVTSTGLRELRAVLEEAGNEIIPEGKKVVSKGALNIKNDAKRRISGVAHAPVYPYTINYDVRTTGTLIEAEVGPDKDKVIGGGPIRTPGNLGNILEFGTPNNAPIPHLAPALEAEAPRFERALGDLAVKLLEGR